MNYNEICIKCQHCHHTLQKGIVCGLTKEKPDFEISCEHYALDPHQEPTINTIVTTPKEEAPASLPDMAVALRKWGITLIVLGVIHLLLSQFLSPIWGVMILALGITNLIVRRKEMFIANGVMLIFIGILNGLTVITADMSNISWGLFGGLQIFLGIKEILKYKKYKMAEGSSDGENFISTETKISEIETTLEPGQSGFGISSFVAFCTSLLIVVVVFSIYIWFMMKYPDGLVEDSIEMGTLGLAGMFGFLISVVGIGFGIASMCQKNRKKILGILGLVFNVLLVLILLTLVFLGE